MLRLLVLLLAIGGALSFRSSGGGRLTRSALSLVDLGRDSPSFKETIDADDAYVVVDFYATWCGPCKLAAKTFQQVAQEMEGSRLRFVKVDTEEHEHTVSDYGLKGLPVFAVFKDGEMLAKHEGNLGKTALVDFIRRGVPSI